MNTNQRKVLRELQNIENRTIDQVAKSAGVSRGTVYNYLKDADFLVALGQSESATIKNVTTQLTKLLNVATSTLSEIIGDESHSANLRRMAANNIFDNFVRLRQLSDLEDRIGQIERRLEQL